MTQWIVCIRVKKMHFRNATPLRSLKTQDTNRCHSLAGGGGHVKPGDRKKWSCSPLALHSDWCTNNSNSNNLPAIKTKQKPHTFNTSSMLAIHILTVEDHTNSSFQLGSGATCGSHVQGAPALAAVHEPIAGGKVPVEGHAVQVLRRLLVAHHLHGPRKD